MLARIKPVYMVAVLLCISIVLGGAWPVSAAVSYNVNMVIDGQPVLVSSGDQPAFVMDGRTYVPLRVVSEGLGASVDWLPATRQVVITSVYGQNGTIPARSGVPGDIQIVIDGRVLDIPAGHGKAFITKRNRVVVPVRVVGEALGCKVDWLTAKRTVVITSAPPPTPARGDAERPETGTAPQPVPEGSLLQELAAYRTNLKLLDGTVINSADLLNRPPGSFSAEQLEKFRAYKEQLARYDAQIRLPDGSVLVTADFTIRGPAIASAEQLKAWIAAETPRIKAKVEQEFHRTFIPIPDLADLYLRIGKEYGIRGDVAFCQAAKETFYWQFTGSVQPFQNNYCGLWAVGSPCTGREPLNGADPSQVSFQPGVHGAIFASPEAGVEAHIQHLYAYACKDPLPPGKILLDPRFILVARGSAPTWQGLNARWAVPGVTYGQSIIQDYWLKSIMTR